MIRPDNWKNGVLSLLDKEDYLNRTLWVKYIMGLRRCTNGTLEQLPKSGEVIIGGGVILGD